MNAAQVLWFKRNQGSLTAIEIIHRILTASLTLLHYVYGAVMKPKSENMVE